MASREADIKRIYERHREDEPLNRLWEWARNGETKRERYRRFRALERWAKAHRDHAPTDKARRQWDGRRKVYRRRKRQILTRIRDRAERLGEGAYAGSASFIDIIVMPLYAKHGIPPTSRKRWETFGNPDSDHWFGNRDADALDGGIENAQWLHDEIADECRRHGVPLSSQPSDFELVFCTTPNGNRYRFQGIAATHGTGPHYHAGWRRV